MPAPQQIPQTTFAAGEVSPMVAVRTDIATYNAALARARNAIIHPQGAISNRSGSIFVGQAQAGISSNTVLVDFARNENSVFLIEFSAAYIRVWNAISNTSPWNHTTPNPDIAVPYTDAQIKNLKFLQSADTLFVFCSDHPVYELRYVSDTNWTFVKSAIKGGPFRVSNDDPSKELYLYADKQAATNFIVKSKTAFFTDTMVGSLLRIGKSVPAQGYQAQLRPVKNSPNFLAGGGTSWTFFTSGTWSGDIYLQRSYDLENWEDLRVYNSSSNINYEDGGAISEMCWLRIAVKKTLGGSTQANVSFNVQAFMFDAIFKIVTKVNNTEARGNLENDIEGLALFLPSTNIVPDMQKNTEPEGTVSSSGGTADNAYLLFCGNVAKGATGRPARSWVYYDLPEGKTAGANKFKLTSSAAFGTSKQIQFIVKSKKADGSDDNYDSGNLELPEDETSYSYEKAFTRKTNVYRVEFCFKTALDNKVIAQFYDTPDPDWTDEWSEGAFSDKNGYPTNGAFYQDRLVLASTKVDPAGVWMSKTGFYTDFGISNPLEDSDSISINLPSRKINRITNIAVLSDIVVFTSEGSFSIGAGGGAISPFNILSKPQSYRGASDVTPAVVGNRVLFVSSRGFYLRDMAYALSDDGYDGEDLRVRAGHLFEGRQIVDIAYQQYPDSLLWALRDDGKLIALTYMREQQILALTLCETDGFIENIAVVATAKSEQLYMVVKRGSAKYIERMEPRTFDTTMQPCEFGSYERLVNDCFLDCATVKSAAAPFGYLTGLTRFNNREVMMNLDGSIYRGTVNGSGRLDFIVAGQQINAYRAIVGLPFVFEMQTLSLSMQGMNIANVVGKTPFARLDFYKSVGGKVGAMGDALYPLIQRTDEAMGMPVKLQTGKTERINLETRSQTTKAIRLVQDEALPMTVLAVSVAVMGGEK